MRTFEAQLTVTFTEEDFKTFCAAPVTEMTKHFAENWLQNQIEDHDNITVFETTGNIQRRQMKESLPIEIESEYKGEDSITVKRLH